MQTVGDLFGRERRSDRPALVDATGREYDYHWVCTTSWKAGNFLRHTGVRRGVTVGVVGEGPLALLAFFGTALLEGTTRFDPVRDLADEEAVRTLVAPTGALDEYALPAGAQRVAYGGQPDEPGVHHFDAGLWSENPSFPPVTFDPETVVLEGSDGRRESHRAVVDAARGVAEAVGIEEGVRVAVRGPLSDPRVVTAGVIAPLLVGGTIVLTGDDSSADGDPRGDVAVGAGTGVPEPTTVDPDGVSLQSSEGAHLRGS